MDKVRSPRAVFVDHPVGRTFGPPHDRARHEQILAKALAELPEFTEPRQIRDLHTNWFSDGSREWEEQLLAEMLHDR